MSVIRLIEEAHSAHVAAHGRECGIVVGSAPRDNPCVMVRRAWATTHQLEAARDLSSAWAKAHSAHRRKYMRGYWETHKPERPERPANGPSGQSWSPPFLAVILDKAEHREAERAWYRANPGAIKARIVPPCCRRSPVEPED